MPSFRCTSDSTGVMALFTRSGNMSLTAFLNFLKAVGSMYFLK